MVDLMWSFVYALGSVMPLLVGAWVVFVGVSFLDTRVLLRKVLTMVALFVTVAVWLITLHQEFLGLLIIIIYAGAIAVLFLFLVIFHPHPLSTQGQTPVKLIVSSLGVLSVLWWFALCSSSPTPLVTSWPTVMGGCADLTAVNDLSGLTVALWSHNLVLVIALGLLLLVAVIAVVALTTGLVQANLRKKHHVVAESTTGLPIPRR